MISLYLLSLLMISIFDYRYYECYCTLCYMYLQVIRINIIIIIIINLGLCTLKELCLSWGTVSDMPTSMILQSSTIRGWYRGPRFTPNKRFEPVFSTVIMAVCSLFNRMLLLTDLIPLHLLYCGQTVMIGSNHTSFEWTRAVRHIYGIIRHM